MHFRKFPLITASLIALTLHTPTIAKSNGNDLPDLGTSALTVLSVEKEKKLGYLIYNELRGQAAVIHDPLISEYINGLGNRLVAHSEDVKFPFTFFSLNNPSINAFAFYGGHIGIHTGLVSAADSESQLASVLAHEIAHVTQRHLARRQEASSKQGPLTLGGIIGSILLAAISPQAMMASMMATTAGAQQMGINHTRQNEREADNIGMNILSNAGYDPYASAEFFSKLVEQSRYKSKMPQFLLTHPLPDSRVTDARLRAQQFEKKFYADSLEFLLIKTRIRARFEESQHKEERFRSDVEKLKGNKLFAAQYGLALTLLDNGELKEAEQLLRKLWQQSPNNLYVLDGLSDLYIAKKLPEQAFPMLQQAFQYRPNNAVVTLNYANVAINAKQYDKAIQLLSYYLLEKPNDFLATQLLRDAYKQSKNMAKYHATSAEYFALASNYQAAIKAVDRALNHLTTEDKAEISRLEALQIKYRKQLTYIKDIQRS